MTYVPLRVRSDFSFGHGASSINDIVKRAGAIALEACGLTDVVSMSGCFAFSTYMAKKGVQPLIGCNFVIEHGDIVGDVLLFAQNEQGYINLSRLLEIAFTPVVGRNKKLMIPEVPKLVLSDEVLSLFSDVIVLSGNKANGLAYASLKRDNGKTIGKIEAVSEGRFYVEICRLGGKHDATESLLLDFAYGRHDGRERPIVGTTDCWYANKEDALAFEMLAFSRGDRKNVVLVDGQKWADEGILAPADSENIETQHIPDDETFSAWFSDLPEAIHNTSAIAKRSYFLVEGRAPVLPPFECPAGESESDFLVKMANDGLQEKIRDYGLEPDIYQARLDFELSVIINMGFPGYFLIVSDFIKWAKKQDISVGMGRGSGAGSLVAWCLKITDVNPVTNGLLFERFLNPERVSMPDFDIDFDPDDRERVIEYVRTRYGHERVTMISAFGRILSKSAIELAARSIALAGGSGTGDVEISGFSDISRIRSFIPDGPGADSTLSSLISENPDFSKMVEEDSKIRLLLKAAMLVEGLHSHQTKHAAGVVIGGEPLYRMFPVIRDRKEMSLMSAYDMKGTETVGAVKFDFLGLKNLSIIKLTLTLMRQAGITEEIDMSFNDDGVYALLREGLTQGVFQFASAGMVNALQLVRPDRFAEIVAILALYRPGPMKYLDSFAARKLGREEVLYPLANYAVAQKTVSMTREQALELARSHNEDKVVADIEAVEDLNDLVKVSAEKLNKLAQSQGIALVDNPCWPKVGNKMEETMAETYGYFIYQEQVMQVARDAAGYTYAGADMLRRAMGKKIREEMARQKGIFIEGCAANGVSEHDATTLFDDIERFADYGFNKSHAVAYAVVCYQTMWLKYHYPEFFYSALLIHKTSDKETTRRIMNEMIVAGVSVRLPDINLSQASHTPVRNGKERYILMGLQGIGSMSSVSERLIQERNQTGPYTSLVDFWKRTKKLLTVRHYGTLVDSGAMDSLDPYRQDGQACRQRILSILLWLNGSDKPDDTQTSMFGEDSYIIPRTFEIRHHINKKKNTVYQTEEMPDFTDRGVREFNQIGFSMARSFILEKSPLLANCGFRMSSGLSHMMEAVGIKDIEDARMVLLPEAIGEKIEVYGLDRQYARARAIRCTDGLNDVIVYVSGKNAGSVEAALIKAMNSRTPIAVFGKFSRMYRHRVFFARHAIDAVEYINGVSPSPDIAIVMKGSPGPKDVFKMAESLMEKKTDNPFGGQIYLVSEAQKENAFCMGIPDRTYRLRGHETDGLWPVTEHTGLGMKQAPLRFDISEEMIETLRERTDVVDIIQTVLYNQKQAPDSPKFLDTGTYNGLLASEVFWEQENGVDYGQAN